MSRQYQWLLLFHILAAMVCLGGFALTLLSVQVLRSGEPDAIARFTGSLRLVGPLILVPAMAAVIAFGIWLVLDRHSRYFGQSWVWLALVLFGAAFLIGAGYQSRTAIGAQRAAGEGDYGETARQLRRWSWGMRAILLLLVVITWDMVTKPGL